MNSFLANMFAFTPFGQALAEFNKSRFYTASIADQFNRQKVFQSLPQQPLPQQNFRPLPHQNLKQPVYRYNRFFPQFIKTGSVLLASMLGGLMFGPSGAIAGGALTASGLGALGEFQKTGRISSTMVLLNTVIGGLSPVVGKVLLKRFLGPATLLQSARDFIGRGIGTGIVGGSLFAYLSNFVSIANLSKHHTGRIQWRAAHTAGIQALPAGLLSGALVGGLFTSRSKLHFLPFESPDNLPSLPNDQTRPVLKPSNKASLALLQSSEDDFLMNLHLVDAQASPAKSGRKMSLYRGAVPHCEAAFDRLANDYDVGTIIDLRGSKTSTEKEIAFEKAQAARKGIQYQRISMNNDEPITQEHLDSFIYALIDAQKNGTGNVLVHCKHGIDRTGALIAAYERHYMNYSPKEIWSSLRKCGYNKNHERAQPHTASFVNQLDDFTVPIS
ncbi:MAG: dual specificity protein phosphatase family protein [Cyanobacteria bacterium P01_H01_bin.74]